MRVTGPTVGALLSAMADVLEETVVPAVTGEKARQQCRAAAVLARRLAVIEDGRDDVFRADEADALATEERVRQAPDGAADAQAALTRRSLDRWIGLISLPDEIGRFSDVEPS